MIDNLMDLEEKDLLTDDPLFMYCFSQFFSIGSPEILQLFDGISRIISKKDPWRMKHDDGIDGLKTIHKLFYTIDEKSNNSLDNQYIVENSKIFVINIITFLTGSRFEHDQYYNYDLREPPRQVINPNQLSKTSQKVSTTDDWTNIPYYPTKEERKNMTNNSNSNFNGINNHISQNVHNVSPTDIYSPEYARKLGVKPRATASVNIGLGGVRF
jgi:hypothetical protein